MSYVPQQIPIILRHRWSLLTSGIRNTYRAMTTSTSFLSDDLPGMKFNIVSGMSRENNALTVVLSKTPYDPAKATIKIFVVGGWERMTVNVDSWINQITLDEICYVTDTSVFECEITWYGCVKKLPTINLYHSIRHFHSRQELCDFKIIVDGEKIPVHKVILAAQSPYFSAIFRTEMIESANNQLIVKDIEVDIMKKVIEFLYTGEIDSKLDVDIVVSILSAADRYQMMDLKFFCGEILVMKLAVSNVLEIAENASLYEIPQLLEHTIDFMICNNHAITKLEGFAEFGARNPKLLVEYNIHLGEILHAIFHDKNPLLKRSVTSIDARCPNKM